MNESHFQKNFFLFHFSFTLWNIFFLLLLLLGYRRKQISKNHTQPGEKKRNKIDAIFDEEKIIQSSRCPSLNKTQTNKQETERREQKSKTNF